MHLRDRSYMGPLAIEVSASGHGLMGHHHLPRAFTHRAPSGGGFTIPVMGFGALRTLPRL